MNKKLKFLLEFLEGELNPEKQKLIVERHKKALNWEELDLLPLVITYPFPEENKWQPYPYSEAFDDPEKMMYNELVTAFNTSILLHNELNDDLPYTIRVNLGTVIIASLFGGAVEQRGDNPPWIIKFESKDIFRSIFDLDPLDFNRGLCKKVINTYKFFNDVLSQYPVLNSCIKIVLPDLQGPVDTLEMLRGSDLFMDFITDPEMVHDGLDLMASAQIGLAKHLQQFITNCPSGYSFQQAVLVRGNILIRDDSVVMISPEMYSEQVAVHDEKVLFNINGGGIHSCGRIDYCLSDIFKLPSIKCFDFGQSYMNDIDLSYLMAKEKNIPLIRVQVSKDELEGNKIMKRFPTGVSLIYDAASFREAVDVRVCYFSQQH